MDNSSLTNESRTSNALKRNFILFSPLLVVFIDIICANLFKPILDVWTWVPLIIVYWLTILFFILWGGKVSIKQWLGPSRGHWGWSLFVIVLSLSSLQMILTQWQLLRPWWIWLSWLLVGIINPFLEEGYWRGLLLDWTDKWPSWLSIGYSSVFFMLNHPLAFGVTSEGCRHPILIVNAFVIGVVFSIVYRKTKSLRWLIVAHALADLLGLSVPIFLNLFRLPQL